MNIKGQYQKNGICYCVKPGRIFLNFHSSLTLSMDNGKLILSFRSFLHQKKRKYNHPNKLLIIRPGTPTFTLGIFFHPPPKNSLSQYQSQNLMDSDRLCSCVWVDHQSQSHWKWYSNGLTKISHILFTMVKVLDQFLQLRYLINFYNG